MKNILIGWLAARGVVLANDASDQAVVEAVQKAALESSNSAAALANDKAASETKITTLTTERDQHKQRADQNATALANEQTQRKAERKAAIGAVVDAAIKLGVCTVAERDAKITVLENSSDLVKDANALITTTPTHRTTTGARIQGAKESAALENERTTMQEYNEKFTECLPLCNHNPIKADAMVKKKYPALIEKIRSVKLGAAA